MSQSVERIRFIAVIVIAHTFAYLIAGGLSYQFITKPLWEAPNSLLALYLRTPGHPELWNFAMIWQIPGQLLRAFLLAVTLLPLLETFKTWSQVRRFAFLSILLFVFTHFAAAAPSPANLEGLVYIKPELVQMGFFAMQVEMIMYSLLAGYFMARWFFQASKP